MNKSHSINRGRDNDCFEKKTLPVRDTVRNHQVCLVRNAVAFWGAFCVDMQTEKLKRLL